MKTLVLLSLLSAAQPEQVISRLFAVTPDGPFLSYSWGEHWVKLRDRRGLRGDIRDFACLGPTVFVGGSDGVFVSDDFGENYRRIESFPGTDVTLFLPARLFGLDPTIFVGTAAGLYRSKKGGAEWTQVGESTIATPVRAMAWPGPQLFVAAEGGLYVSEDVGESWSRVEAGLPEEPLLSLTVSQFYGLEPTLFVGSRGAGVYRSIDGGETFEPIGGAAFAASNVHALFWWGELLLVGTDEGLFLSNDGGESLREAREIRGNAVYSILVPLPEGLNQSDIIVGTGRGVFKSSDGGVTFRPVQEGMGAARVLELRTFPPPPQNRERSPR